MLNKILKDFNKAIDNLEEVLDLEKDNVTRDSAIKRFELCFDLAWKSIKNYAKIQGIECYSPRGCFKEAYMLKLIEYSEKWMKIVDDRNLCAHLYSEDYADNVYQALDEYVEMFKKLLEKLKK
ncbi:MAG: HI0074 family nucleotidyltransferase substrate-binding subunit [Candidatus Falkowbacteria bacterium]